MPYIDFASFADPLEGDAPAGENLEYDQRFAALERLAEGKPSAQFGATIVEAEPPEWKTVSKDAAMLLKETRDLRVACSLVRAGMALDGLAGLHAGLSMIAGWVEPLWETVYPQLDADDGDPIERINALAVLCDPQTLAELKAVPLVQSREHGTVLIGDLEVAFAEAAGGADSSMAPLRATFSGIGVPASVELHALLRVTVDAVKRIELAFNERLQGVAYFDLTALRVRLSHALSAIERFLPAAALVDEAEVDGSERDDDRTAQSGTDSSGGGSKKGMQGISGDIASRADVVKTIDKICEYYTRFEPANPMPLFLARARRMVEMNFLDLLQELVPDSLPQARTVIGLPTD